jgi:hypothetical protein
VPVLVALPLGLTLGAMLVWPLRTNLRRAASHDGFSHGLGVAALFSLFVFAPVGGYFMTFEPDWSLAYLLDTAQTSPALLPALLMLELVSVPAGFLLGATALRRGDESALLRCLLAGSLTAVGVLMLGARRFAVHGSYAQYHGDFGTQPLAGSALGYAVLLLGFWLAAGLIFALWNLRRLDRT